MAQRESQLSRKIMAALRLEGWFCFKVHGSETMMAGLPDVIVCARGRFIGLETKNPGDEMKTSAIQDRVHEKIEAAGGGVHVVSSPAQAVAVVRAHVET
jgi:Holliday junction resolvase